MYLIIIFFVLIIQAIGYGVALKFLKKTSPKLSENTHSKSLIYGVALGCLTGYLYIIFTEEGFKATLEYWLYGLSIGYSTVVSSFLFLLCIVSFAIYYTDRKEISYLILTSCITSIPSSTLYLIWYAFGIFPWHAH